MKNQFKISDLGTSLVVQWLRLWVSSATGVVSIPDWGTKILHATPCGQKRKKRKKFQTQVLNFSVTVPHAPHIHSSASVDSTNH